jgi:TP901 family phage tail tape measure protein
MTTVGSVTIEIDGSSYRFNREMRQAEAQAMSSNRRIRGEFKKTGLAAETMAGSISRAKGAIITFGAVAAGAVTVGAIAKFQQFEKTMSEVKAVTQATGKDFEKLTKLARQLGATTTFSASEVAKGMAELGRAGLAVDEIIQNIPTTLKLAQAGILDLGTASDIMTNVAQGFQITADEAGRVGDVLAKTASRSNTDIQGLGYAMAYAAPLSKAFGVSLEEAAAAIGLFSNNGIKGSAAGTGLRQALVQLHKETPKGTKLLARYGLTYADLNVEVRGFVPVLESLAKANISASDATAIFQARAAGGITILSRQIDQFKELNKETDNATGTLDGMSETLTDNLFGAVKEFTSAWEELMITIGKSVEAEEKVRSLTSALQGFNNFIAGPASNEEMYENQIRELENILRKRIRLEADLEEAMKRTDQGRLAAINSIEIEMRRTRNAESRKREEIWATQDALEDQRNQLVKNRDFAQSQVGKGNVFSVLTGDVQGNEEVIEYNKRINALNASVRALNDDLNNVSDLDQYRAALLLAGEESSTTTDKLDALKRALLDIQEAGGEVWSDQDIEQFRAVAKAADDVKSAFKEASDQTSFDLELASAQLRQAELAEDETAIQLARDKVEALREELRLEQEIADLKRDGFSDQEALDIATSRVKKLKDAGDFKVRGDEKKQDDSLLTEYATDLKSITKRSMKEAIVEGDWGKAFEDGIRGAAVAGMEKAMDSLMDSLFSIFSGGPGGGGGILSSLIDGFRASGGPVSSGKSYIVGEEGPELFTPSKSGHIIPNGAVVKETGGSAMAPVVVNANLIVQGHVTDDFVAIAQQHLAAHAANLPKLVQTEVQRSQRRGRFG